MNRTGVNKGVHSMVLYCMVDREYEVSSLFYLKKYVGVFIIPNQAASCSHRQKLLYREEGVVNFLLHIHNF